MTSQFKKKIIYEVDKVPIGYYDKVYNRRAGVQSKWHHIKFDFVKKKMENHFVHLDYACASGTFIHTLDQKNLSIGVDISRKQINYAKKNYQTKNHNFTVSKFPLPYKKSTFDIITILELIEHCNKKQNDKIFNEVYRVLKPGGKLIITTPNYFSFWPLLEKIVNSIGQIDYNEQHINFFNKKKLYDFLSKKKFDQINIETFIYFSPFLAILSWKLSSFIAKLEQLFSKTPFGFLLCATFIKKK